MKHELFEFVTVISRKFKPKVLTAKYLLKGIMEEGLSMENFTLGKMVSQFHISKWFKEVFKP